MQQLRHSLVFVLLLVDFRVAVGTVIDQVAQMSWDGVAMYIPVDRQAVQQKLNEFHNSMAGECNRPALFLPETPVFPDLLNKDQHVVYLDIGYAVFNDYKDYPDSDIDVQGVAVAVTIPFLSDKYDSKPHFSLAFGKMYDRSRGEIGKPNIAFPYIPIDEVTMNDDGAILRNGTDEMRLSFRRYTDPCKKPPSVVRHEFENFIKYDMQIGAPEPHFDVCDRHPYNNTFCSIVKDIRCDVSRYAPNFCQLAWKSDDMVACEASVEILNVTSGFRDILLVKEGPINLIATESLRGHFPIGLKYPCIE